MTLNQFTVLRSVVAMALASVVAFAVLKSNFAIAVFAVAAAMAIVLIGRSCVTEIIADERDRESAGRASVRAIQIFSIGSIVFMFFMFAERHTNPYFETAANTLAYATCTLMLLQAFFLKYYDRVALATKKWPKAIILAIVFAIIFIIGARIFSGEDSWVCKDGAWVKHGVPSSPPPTAPCPK